MYLLNIIGTHVLSTHRLVLKDAKMLTTPPMLVCNIPLTAVLLIVYQEIPERVPMIRIYISANLCQQNNLLHKGNPSTSSYRSNSSEDIHILHTTPQARLHGIRIPPEDIHHESPTQTREHRPRIGSDLRSCFWTEEVLCG